MKRPRNKLRLQASTDTPWTHEEIPSSLHWAHEFQEKVLAACRRFAYSEHDLYAIRLALEESLINAVKHGNRNDPAKHVKVAYRVSRERLDVVIEDEGVGFDPDALPDPRLDENLEKEHGRGVLLMRSFMNEVVFTPPGNKVTLTKFNETLQAPSAAHSHVAFG